MYVFRPPSSQDVPFQYEVATASVEGTRHVPKAWLVRPPNSLSEISGTAVIVPR